MDFSTTPVGVANLTLHSLFKSVDVYFNEVLVESNQEYRYTSYLSTLLHNAGDSQASWAQSSLYFPDTAGHFDDLTNANNPGLVQRSIYFDDHSPVSTPDRSHVYLSVCLS